MIDFNDYVPPDPRQFCSECGGKLMGGAPLRHSTHTISNVTRDLYWCITCAEYISSACWDDVEWGPYKFTVTVGTQIGHA
jgi:hypothetical protein